MTPDDGRAHSPSPPPPVLGYATPLPPAKAQWLLIDVAYLLVVFLATAALNVFILHKLSSATDRPRLLQNALTAAFGLEALGSVVWSLALLLVVALMISGKHSSRRWLRRYAAGKLWLEAGSAMIGSAMLLGGEIAGGVAWMVLAALGAFVAFMLRVLSSKLFEE